jgi:hypothetical protein
MPRWRVTLLIPPYGLGSSPVSPAARDRVAFRRHVVLAATQTCEYCVSFEQHLPIVVASDPIIQDVLRLWPTAKRFD